MVKNHHCHSFFKVCGIGDLVLHLKDPISQSLLQQYSEDLLFEVLKYPEYVTILQFIIVFYTELNRGIIFGCNELRF